MQQPTIRLLLINDSAEEAERLISMLQNAGRSVRATHAESSEALAKLLQEKVWDLVIATQNSENLSPIEALKIIRRQNKDIPMIMLTDKEGSQPSVEGLKIGAKDVVQLDEDQHLLLVIDRELSNRSDREKRRTAERRFNTLAQRNQQLLDNSRDAIAFVQDGMFLYANESFAELLGYEDRDDIECMPVIDIVAAKQHDTLKSFLKNFMLKVDEEEVKEMELHLIQQDGTEKPINFSINKDVYDEESCIQLIYHSQKGGDSEELQAQLEEYKNQDALTGLYNKNYMTEALNACIRKAADKEFNSAVLHIGIDNFQETVSAKLGVGAIDKALAAIAQHTQSLVKKTDVLCRYGDNSFILIAPKITAQRAQERANEIGHELRNHVVSVEGKTLHFNFHIGIAVINETSSKAELPVEHSIIALDQARIENDKDNDVVAVLYEAPLVTQESDGEPSFDIQKALEQGRFRLLFQPILSLRGAEKEHYEVLLRMLNDNGEEISPKEFLNHASSIGATTRIDRWVILEATKTLAKHRESGSDTVLILHLSKESMLDESLIPWLSVVFKTAKLPTDSIIFQLNEVDINDHLNDASNFTNTLKEVGCGVSINHFGCALNPFKALEQVYSSYVKIDGSFTEDLQDNDEGVATLNNLVSELHQKDKISIVPLVESANLLSKLWQSGVHYIQGYYLQAPAENMDYDFDMES
ncbi:EAL domain-containing protein [Agaribacterium sp. ZY112]|uniref:EAL domain-containing response regulator n=1 Tax=Agaribacterium sp. ZY112 TaxID=3233574 RepID=UPI00352312D5